MTDEHAEAIVGLSMVRKPVGGELHLRARPQGPSHARVSPLVKSLLVSFVHFLFGCFSFF